METQIRRTKRYSLAVTEMQHTEWAAAAAAVGLRTTDYIRTRVDAAVEMERKAAERRRKSEQA